MSCLFKRFALLVCVIVTATLCSCSGSGSTANKNIRLNMDIMPQNIDPQLASTDEELVIVRNCFEGMFRIDDGKIVNAACEKYTVSDDGLIYRFTLRKSLKWSDGSPLTADDFKFGITRALRPETLSPDASRLFCIENAEEVCSGTADESTLGIESDGNRTLTLRLTRADSNLLETLSYALSMPCNQALFEKAGGRYGMTPQLTLCNGPFTLSKWDTTSIKLARNSEYTGEFSAVPTQLTLTFGATESEKIESINSGFTDICSIGTQYVGAAEDALLSVSGFYDTCWTLMVNPNASVLGDDRVSAALKKALSKDIYADSLPEGFITAYGIVADDMLVRQSHYKSLVTRPSSDKNSLSEAKSDLIEALKQHKGSLPAITIKYVESDQIKAIATRVAQHWQKELGAVINIEGVTASQLNQNMADGNYQIVICPVSAEDGKAVSVVRNFATDETDNVYGYSDSETDSLIEAAYNTGTVKKSAEKIALAEKRILANEHIYPLAQSGMCFAMSTELTDVQVDMYQGHLFFAKASK